MDMPDYKFIILTDNVIYKNGNYWIFNTSEYKSSNYKQAALRAV